MDQDSKRIRKTSEGNQYDVLHKKDILYVDPRSKRCRPLESILLEIFEYFSSAGKSISSQLTYRLIFRILTSFFDKLLEKVVVDNCVFVFPYDAAYIFVAQRPVNSKSYRYSMSTGTGYYAVYFVFGRNFNTNVYLQLRGKWRTRFIKEVKSGHKYDSYEFIINKIKARHARKLSIPASKIHLRRDQSEVQVEIPEHV